MENIPALPCIMVIFGGTGDLTHRKLIPAICNLSNENTLPENFAVVSIGRRDKTDEKYRDELFEAVTKYSRFKMDEEKWKKFREKIYYRRFEFSDNMGYIDLKEFLSCLDEKYNTKGNRIYYMAVAPEYFELILSNIERHNMARNLDSWQRLVIEKPFGRDLKTAQYLNDAITNVFEEKETFRIDHYLGKEMIQNIMVIRFANAMFESIWSSKYIDNIQISSSETVGSENRAGYYEKSGALRDMIQNHMLQLLAITAMEQPETLETEAIRDEKVKVLRLLKPLNQEGVAENVIRGQYGPGTINNKSVPGYRQEEKISPSSNTETFIALEIQLGNSRWGDMPFYLRTGKRLKEKAIEIVIQFKSLYDSPYFKRYGEMEPNLLVIRIQPGEGVCFQFNGKKPGTGNEIFSVKMDYCQNCETMGNSPEAYERLIFDVIRGDSTLFTRWDEIEASWKFVDSIANAWEKEAPTFPNYDSGTWGPMEADKLLDRENRKWWFI